MEKTIEEELRRVPLRERVPMDLPEATYRNDADFRTVVDMLEALIHQAQLSPYEIRAAAMLAAIHYEMRRPLNIRVTKRPDGTYDIAEVPK